ncbi:MAG: SRPBCC family protein [Hyphomicrobiales bacterium]
MRMFKLTLIALAAIVAWSASAYAITVKKRIEAPGLPDEVWVVAGESFCTIKDWHPAVAECEEVTEDGNTYRILTLGDGGKIKEKLTDKDDLSYSYEIVESPLPIKNYSSKLWVEEDDEPDRTVIYWESKFDAAEGTEDDEAKKIIFGILSDGVKGIKKNAIAAWDKREAAAGNEVSKGRDRSEPLEGDDDDDDDDDDE